MVDGLVVRKLDRKGAVWDWLLRLVRHLVWFHWIGFLKIQGIEQTHQKVELVDLDYMQRKTDY